MDGLPHIDALTDEQLDTLRRFAVRAELCRAPESAGRLSDRGHEGATMAIARRGRQGRVR